MRCMMKRKSYDTNSKDPLNNRIHDREDFEGVSSFNGQFGTKSTDNGLRKKVRFIGLDSDNRVNYPQHASTKCSERTQTIISDDPKTSEYAFFKKFKEEVGYGSHLHSPSIEKGPPKFKSNDHTRERANICKKSYKDLDSTLPLEHIRPISVDYFISPIPRAPKSNNPVDVDLREASSAFEDTWSIEKYINDYGTRERHADVFSSKRKKLCQWVSDTSFPEIDEFGSKGYNIISVLLSRLFPEDHKDDSFKTSSSLQLETDTRSEITLPESEIHFKKPNLMPARIECGSYWNDASSCWPYETREVFLSNIVSPICPADVPRLPYRVRESDLQFRRGTAISVSENDSSFGFPFKSSWHVEELDHFHEPSRSLFEREPHRLDWGSDSRIESNIFTSPSTELIAHPMLPILWKYDYQSKLDGCFSPMLSILCKNDYQTKLDDGFSESGLCVPSITHYPSNFYALLPSHSACYCNSHFARHVYEDKEDIFLEPNNYETNYQNLDEDINFDTELESRSIIISPQSESCFISRDLKNQHKHRDMEGLLLSSAPELDSHANSWEHLSYANHILQTPQKDDKFSHFLSSGDEYKTHFKDSVHGKLISHFCSDNLFKDRDFSSFYINTSWSREKACPLLLDKPSWDGSEDEF